MLVQGFVTANDMFMSVIHWGHLHEAHMAMGICKVHIDNWKFQVRFVLVDEYDRQLKGKYAFCEDDIQEVAERLKNYYENMD